MNHVRKMGIFVALVVLGACLVGAFMTRGAMQHLSFLNGKGGGRGSRSAKGSLVDQRPWQTAQTLAALAGSTEEKNFAREAQRLADHEVDQAFAQALRQASAESRQLKGKALELQQRVTELQQIVKDDTARVAALTAKVAAEGAAAASDQDDLDVAKAQLGLDNDELSDSQEDLARESGDQRGKIQQELSAREAAMKKYDASLDSDGTAQTAVVSAGRFRTLAGQISAWFEQRNRMQLLEQAEAQAQADVKTLSADHDRMEADAKSSETQDAGAKADGSVATGAARVKVLQKMAAQRNILSILDDRIGAQQQLAVIYGRWGDQVALQHRMAAHLILQSVAWIAFVVLVMLLVGWGLQTMLDRLTMERRQRQTLRIILNLSTQFVALVLVLLVVFGTPSQMPTILGLATAGLTVVFQDFILAFCGWFVLMGKNGIRVGDWVEIDGTGGEVVEIGLFRTWLLETGNWTANGHPTGRRVSFLNGFAIRGKYFNFSTAGQWMWDEIKITIPAGEQTYPMVEKIHAAVVKATEENVKMAEQEWKRSAHDEELAQFSAASSIDLRPAGDGVEAVVRYVTRAGSRLETRNKMFRLVVDLMQGGRGIGAEADDAKLVGSRSAKG
jgi:small-conductance mechanosensitive channel